MTQIFQVDAFTDRPFGGNPAAVCLLREERSSEWMQQVAMEQNLSETAFIRLPAEDGIFSLRWFTPEVEVPLCGHATLASAHTLWDFGILEPSAVARFQTRSGRLEARREGARIELDLPAYKVQDATLPNGASEALGVEPVRVARTPERCEDLDFLIEVGSEREVREARPDFATLRELSSGCFIVTARSESAEQDIVSRYFAPSVGIDEDPVTGAAHCSLVPYWTHKLGKSALVCYQASRRGGIVYGRHDGGDRVQLAGDAVTVQRGEFLV